MPYYPEDQSKENLGRIRGTSTCAECGRQLYIYLNRENKRKYLACPTPGHEGIIREYIEPREDYQTNIRREYKMENEKGSAATTAIANIPRTGQLTQVQATTILDLVYPNASKEEITRCAIFCRDFGLHPLANEVYLIPFKGKNVMVVSIQANRKMAHALKGDFSFLDDTPRAATEEEIIKQYGKDSEEARDNIISVTKLQGVGGNLAIGFGLYPKKESPYGMDKGNTRRNMANIRSERQGIDRLPGQAMPKNIEVVDEVYADIPDVGKVNTETGEMPMGEQEKADAEKVVEGEFTEKKEETGNEPINRDTSTITSFSDLCKACLQDFGIKTSKDVLAELGVESQNMITETMPDCYKRIKAVR